MRPGLQTLTTLPLLAAFAETHLAALNERADLARIGPNETLWDQGDSLELLHILLSGFVVETCEYQGKPAFTDVVGPTAPVGFAAAMTASPAPTGARTITSARLILIPVSDLLDRIRDQPSVGLSFFNHALTGIQEQARELCDLKLRSAVQRLAAFLLNMVDDPAMNPVRFVLPYEKRFLAAKIGCSQENLSRAFANLRRLGVETRGSIVVLRDLARLRTFAGMASP
jgi:CRP-like cAMP-binding protein